MAEIMQTSNDFQWMVEKYFDVSKYVIFSFLSFLLWFTILIALVKLTIGKKLKKIEFIEN